MTAINSIRSFDDSKKYLDNQFSFIVLFFDLFYDLNNVLNFKVICVFEDLIFLSV